MQYASLIFVLIRIKSVALIKMTNTIFVIVAFRHL